MFPGAHGGNTPPLAHGSAHDEHPHPGAPPGGRPPPVDGPDSAPSSHSSSNSATDTDSPDVAASAHLHALLSSQPATLPAACARYTLKTSRPPPKGSVGVWWTGMRGVIARFWRVELAVAAQREKEAGSGGRLEGKGGRGCFRERVEAMEKRLASDLDTHGIPALVIREGRAHKPEHQVTYFDGDWEGTVNKFASALPPMTVLINSRDEPRVVFDVGPLVEVLISASSAELTTDLVPVLSMTKLADASVSGGAGGVCKWSGKRSRELFCGRVGSGGALSVLRSGVGCPLVCFLVWFYYRNSWWAGKFEDLNNVKWEDKKDVLYWRGKSNGGHIRGTNYRSFPRFRLMDLAALPENLAKGLFDVRITQWHEWHCTDDCDADTIRNAYNITGESVPREEAYQYKYLLDVNGNTFSGR
ncbi:hypothetical protein B0H13DRAFT_2273986 [Mycena leptocephala]|nr:hypothetical protein B0H13DRAFT_2273986 [Mycena leptocephala]